MLSRRVADEGVLKLFLIEDLGNGYQKDQSPFTVLAGRECGEHFGKYCSRHLPPAVVWLTAFLSQDGTSLPSLLQSVPCLSSHQSDLLKNSCLSGHGNAHL